MDLPHDFKYRGDNLILNNPHLINKYNTQGIEFQVIDWEEKDVWRPKNEFKITLFGCTIDGKSVCVEVDKYKPYLFVEIPEKWKKEDQSKFINDLKSFLKNESKYNYNNDDLIYKSKIVSREKFLGFTNNNKFPFLKIIFKTLKARYDAIKWIKDQKEVKLYESDISPLLRCVHERDILPCGWIYIENPNISEDEETLNNCQINFTCKYTDLKPRNIQKIAPLLVASFDIECNSNTGLFPNAELDDEVIQIGTTVSKAGSDECILKHIVTLKSCNYIDGVIVEECENEKDVLLCWQKFITNLDPDIITGYNITGFDFEYLYKRAKKLKIVAEFCQLGRIQEDEEYLRKRDEANGILQVKQLSSSALGMNILKYIPMKGRVIIDMLKVCQREYKLSSYKLDYVGEHFLKERKVDLKPREIFEKYGKGPEERKEIAVYCIRDCELVNRLLNNRRILPNNIGMANVCYVPLSFIFWRGQGIKCFSLIAKRCREYNCLIPLQYKDVNEDGYQGATVLEAHNDAYFKPITCLDYASLYPRSMISHNLCPTTQVEIGGKYDNLDGIEYIDRKWEQGNYRFVSSKTKKGIIPIVLEELLNKRSEIKKLMKDEKDEDIKSILDGLQLSYKITANSIYGQLGASTSPIRCKPVAASTTYTGRELLIFAKEYVIKHYDARVVYGDTDSIMIEFNTDKEGEEAVKEAIERGKEASRAINKILPKPHDLEYEKVYYPYLLFTKKRYCGLMYEFDYKKPSYIDSKGIVLKRRDNAPIVKKIYGGAIDIIMYERNVQKAYDYIMKYCEDLLNGIVNVQDLIITKSLSGEYKGKKLTDNIYDSKGNIKKKVKKGEPGKWKWDDVECNIAHVKLCQRLAERDPGTAPRSNDRIPYMYIIPNGSSKKILQSDRIEHPEYIKEKQLKIDYSFYITNQIVKPVKSLFEILIEDYTSMFDNILIKCKLKNTQNTQITDFFKLT